ncbi:MULTISPECIES: GHKL domain-containing protein [Lacticaseibacillus]|uniref:GHKL domain-containing protein n=1 Tax=Lacticaseibacillus TaxID=2759736 RepID=UPI00063DCA7C|nr:MULTISPECIES: GHKL domain-containing protein [Lacticaseibacillus]KLI75377.1 hypothetical protein AAW28_07645 [Lacticaseibacillus casei]
MVSIPGLEYLFALSPIYIAGISVLSQIFYARLKPGYIIFWAILGIALSLLFSTSGEILYGLLYIFFMTYTDKPADMLWIFLFMDLNLAIVNIQTIFIGMAEVFAPQMVTVLGWAGIFISETLYCVFVIWLLLTKKHFILAVRKFMQKTHGVAKSMVISTGTICLLLYVLEVVLNILTIPTPVEIFVLCVFLLSIGINVFSILSLLKAFKYNMELTWLKQAEMARKQYSATIDEQRKQTNKILHDYKNLLLTLQVSLNETDKESSSSSSTQALIKQAQNSLSTAEISNDMLTAVESIPLKSLLYLKWNEAAKKGVKMLIRTDKPIPEVRADLGLTVIRILGILIDNALDETLKLKEHQFEVLLLYKPSTGIELTVVNNVPTNFDLKLLNGSGFTTKGTKHGQGMAIINELVEKNSDLNVRKKKRQNHLEISLFVGE